MKDIEGTPSNAVLLKLAQKCPPPMEWYDEDFSGLFGDDERNTMKFGDLKNGDMFNTKAARYVKTASRSAIIVMSEVLKVGNFVNFDMNANVVVLYTGCGS